MNNASIELTQAAVGCQRITYKGQIFSDDTDNWHTLTAHDLLALFALATENKPAIAIYLKHEAELEAARPPNATPPPVADRHIAQLEADLAIASMDVNALTVDKNRLIAQVNELTEKLRARDEKDREIFNGMCGVYQSMLSGFVMERISQDQHKNEVARLNRCISELNAEKAELTQHYEAEVAIRQETASAYEKKISSLVRGNKILNEAVVSAKGLLEIAQAKYSESKEQLERSVESAKMVNAQLAEENRRLKRQITGTQSTQNHINRWFAEKPQHAGEK